MLTAERFRAQRGFPEGRMRVQFLGDELGVDKLFPEEAFRGQLSARRDEKF